MENLVIYWIFRGPPDSREDVCVKAVSRHAPDASTETDGDVTAISDAPKYHAITQVIVTMVTNYYRKICTARISVSETQGA